MKRTTIYGTGTPGTHQRQSGAVLVISLLFLVVVTIIGVAGMSGTTMQERMAGNLRDRKVAFEAAEAALREAEAEIFSWTTEKVPSDSTCTPACEVWAYDALTDADGKVIDPSEKDATWWSNNGLEFGTDGTKEIGEASADPRYMIMQRQVVPDDVGRGHTPSTERIYYSITARGTGATPESIVQLQSSFTKRFN